MFVLKFSSVSLKLWMDSSAKLTAVVWKRQTPIAKTTTQSPNASFGFVIIHFMIQTIIWPIILKIVLSKIIQSAIATITMASSGKFRK